MFYCKAYNKYNVCSKTHGLSSKKICLLDPKNLFASLTYWGLYLKKGVRGCIRMTGLQRDVKWSKPSKPLAQPPTPALSGGITVSTNYTDSTLLVFSIPTMSSKETCILHQVLASPLQRTAIYNAPTLDGWEEPSCDRGLLEDFRAGDIFNPAASLKSTSYLLRKT